jgi:hypothetical protein
MVLGQPVRLTLLGLLLEMELEFFGELVLLAPPLPQPPHFAKERGHEIT